MVWGGRPILCWGIGAGAKEEEDKEDLITFPILLSASSTYNTTLAQVFKTATRPTSHKLTFAGRCRNKDTKEKNRLKNPGGLQIKSARHDRVFCKVGTARHNLARWAWHGFLSPSSASLDLYRFWPPRVQFWG